MQKKSKKKANEHEAHPVKKKEGKRQYSSRSIIPLENHGIYLEILQTINYVSIYMRKSRYQKPDIRIQTQMMQPVFLLLDIYMNHQNRFDKLDNSFGHA